MQKEKIIDQLLNYFIQEEKRFANANVDIPQSYEEKRYLLRGIINLRPPYPLKEEILALEDELLQLELKEKKIISSQEIPFVEGKMALFQGDITTLKVEAIVNPGNAALLGCFLPNHSCLDNQIHTYAGIRLRLACQEQRKGKEASVGEAIITKAYNLPCDYVIHTVGPMITGEVTKKEEDLLALCYQSCLSFAQEKNLKTIAFPSISTGVFRFPKKQASEIAVKTVREYLKAHPNCFEKVIFVVFTKEDKENYDRLF